jgi:muramoyltetrapeptide carboxypeptidase
MAFSRREWSIASLGLMSGAVLPIAHATPLPPLVKPARLKVGDTVALVAPSGGLDDAAIERRVRALEGFGLKIKHAENLRARRGNFAGSIAERVSDLHDAFSDRDVRGIWAARGGSGGNQLLPHLNYRLIAANPKILVGYSDTTALHLAILRYSRLVTFHGPTAGSTFNEYTSRHLMEALMIPTAAAPIEVAPANLAESLKNPEFATRVIRPGTATGRLIGGNLSVVAALAGTPYAADFRHALVFLEDVNEEPYRIDRMLTQLNQNSPFARAAGIVLGVSVAARRKETILR